MQKGWARFVRAQPFASSTIRLLKDRCDVPVGDTREKMTRRGRRLVYSPQSALDFVEILSRFTAGPQRHTCNEASHALRASGLLGIRQGFHGPDNPHRRSRRPMCCQDDTDGDLNHNLTTEGRSLGRPCPSTLPSSRARSLSRVEPTRPTTRAPGVSPPRQPSRGSSPRCRSCRTTPRCNAPTATSPGRR